MKKQKFTLSKDHIKLLRRFQVGWQDCETGAPEIDPKRPYGNSDVETDMHEILTGKDQPDGCPDGKREEYLKLHREMENALQIVLVTGSFKPGKYEADEYSSNWRLVA